MARSRFLEIAMDPGDVDVIVVGAGIAGLSCARHLLKKDVSCRVFEAGKRIGGRLKTDHVDGFVLNHGFQVLQTAYPEARRQLDFHRLQLKSFAPGAIIRVDGKFHRVSDPKRRPQDIWTTLRAPIGSILDRLRFVRIASGACCTAVSDLFQRPDETTLDFLRAEGISEKMIDRFIKPFFGGVCLDPEIQASKRVFTYILRVFAEGDVALPARGMGAIPEQIAEELPEGTVITGTKVESVRQGAVWTAGQEIGCRAVVLATERPEVERLLGKPASIVSHGEVCLYFRAEEAPIDAPYLILNGESGIINSITVPSVVASGYAPPGEALISVVVIGHPDLRDNTIESVVREELAVWFGTAVNRWRHLKTYRIVHGLPDQAPPMPDPTQPRAALKPGVFVCGEYRSVPGIQWALLSGRHAAEAVVKALSRHD